MQHTRYNIAFTISIVLITLNKPSVTGLTPSLSLINNTWLFIQNPQLVSGRFTHKWADFQYIATVRENDTLTNTWELIPQSEDRIVYYYHCCYQRKKFLLKGTQNPCVCALMYIQTHIRLNRSYLNKNTLGITKLARLLIKGYLVSGHLFGVISSETLAGWV